MKPSKKPIKLNMKKRESSFGGNMKLSARNILKGTVTKINQGAVNSEIIIELPGGMEIVSIITKSSVKSLGLKKGKEVYAVIKASNVMIGVDE
jgi:molybdopterin-binding protein